MSGSMDILKIRTKRAIRHMTPAHMVKKGVTKRTVQQFADRVGLVYFGYISQRDEGHRLVRGHTVSPTHVDDNYAVGSLKGYDVAVLTRNDVVRVRRNGDLHEQRCHWLICTVDLHTRFDLPHMYIGHWQRDEVFAAAYGRLTPIPLGTFGAYPEQFAKEYTIYGAATHAITIERLITPQIAGVIQSHFHGSSIEIEDNTIYIYIESKHPDEVLLEKMLSNGLWLAETLDTRLSPTGM